MRLNPFPGATFAAFTLFTVCTLTVACGSMGHAQQEEQCTAYPPQLNSPYILPYAAGQAHPVIQGNCAPREHPWTHFGAARYAYDFGMPIGTPVLAAREGAVGFVRDNFSDDEHGKNQGNVVILVHPDGTVALYGHLTKNGALVKVGQIVRQGERIGTSGNSGESPTPHLHFQVIACGDFNTCPTVPVTFKNAEPPAQRLEKDAAYTAR